MEVSITILYSHSYFTKSTRRSYFKWVSQKFKIHQALMEVNRKSIFVGCTASFFHNTLSKARETGQGGVGSGVYDDGQLTYLLCLSVW